MGADQVLKEIKDSGLAGQQFWYIYAIVVTSLLVLLITSIIFLVKGFLTSFLTDMKETHKSFAKSIASLTESNTKLTLMVELHSDQIEKIDEKLEDMSKRRRQ